MGLAFDELLALLDDRSRALRAAVKSAPELSRQVPGCPDWSLGDLIRHLGEVQRHWAAAVLAGPADSEPAGFGERAPAGELPVPELLAWSAGSTAELLDALRSAGADSGCWTWWGSSGAPMTSGAVARHQVQEAAVHAFDAQDTAGSPEPLPIRAAVDGVDEFLTVGCGALAGWGSPWPRDPATALFRSTEGPAWRAELSATGVHVTPGGDGGGDVTVSGTASDLVLLLYRRRPLGAVDVAGDRQLLDSLLDWAGGATD